MTKTEAEEIDRLFGTHSRILTKGIDYSQLVFAPIIPKKPIRMVYTGNLLIGRAKSLVEISKAMANINRNNENIILDIYSPTALDDKTMEYLNANGCHFKGSVPKCKIDVIQKSADVVVFVESLEKEHRFDARLSFSTKLTDYFKNGKCIFAIGDRNIAPIIYLRENDCAIIANEYKEIEKCLYNLMEKPNIINDFAQKAFETGRKNHNVDDMKKTFIDAFICANAAKKS